jgi:predicted neuraminidase
MNAYVGDCGSFQLQSLAAMAEVLKMLPRVASAGQYHLLFVDAENEKVPPDVPECRLLARRHELVASRAEIENDSVKSVRWWTRASFSMTCAAARSTSG